MLEALLLAGLGGVLAIAGTVAGQFMQARNAQHVRAEEFTREDRYRLHRDRLEAYREYHVALGGVRPVMALYSRSKDDTELHNTLKEERNKAWRAYTLVWLIGEEKVVDAASGLLKLVDDVTWHGAGFQPDLWGAGIRAYVEAARSDLLQPPLTVGSQEETPGDRPPGGLR